MKLSTREKKLGFVALGVLVLSIAGYFVLTATVSADCEGGVCTFKPSSQTSKSSSRASKTTTQKSTNSGSSCETGNCGGSGDVEYAFIPVNGQPANTTPTIAKTNATQATSATQATDKPVYFFTLPGCGNCEQMKPIMAQLAKEYQIKVITDDASAPKTAEGQKIAQQYLQGEQTAPVIVIGNKKTNGVQSGATLRAMLSAYANKRTTSATTTSSKIKLLVTNYVANPETALGDAKYKDRKGQCSVLDFDIKSFKLNDASIKSAVYAQLKTMGITAVTDLTEFKKIDAANWATTAIYDKTRDQDLKCPEGTEAYKVTTTSTTTTQEKNQCPVTDNRITVAINNYPENVADHSYYTKKMNDQNFRCDKIKIPVKNAKLGLQNKDNLADVEKYLREQVQGIIVVKDKAAFDALSGDDMKKAVILSSLKCDCAGPNSTHYIPAPTFKDKDGKIEERGNLPTGLQIGDGLADTSSNANAEPTTATTAPSFTYNKPDSTNACIKGDKVTVCFFDKETQDLYTKGDANLKNLMTLATAGATKNISRIKQGTLKHSYIVFGTMQNITATTRDENMIAYTEASSGTTDGIPASTYVSYFSTSFLKNAQWDNALFETAANHEWGHTFDSTNSITQNASGIFATTYKATGYKSGQTPTNKDKYPDCIFKDLTEINAVTLANKQVAKSGHPQDNVAELYASTFETYTTFYNAFIKFFDNWKGEAKCQQELTRLIAEQAKYFSR